MNLSTESLLFWPSQFSTSPSQSTAKMPSDKKQYTNQSLSTHWLQWRRHEILWNQRTRFVLFTSMRAQNTELSPAIQLTRERSVTDCGRTETKNPHLIAVIQGTVCAGKVDHVAKMAGGDTPRVGDSLHGNWTWHKKTMKESRNCER